MQDTVAARAVFGLTAVVVAVGLVVQLFAAADSDGGFFTGGAAAANTFCYFTIQSNIALGASCALLAIGWIGRSLLFGVVRMIGVVGISLTFLVYHAVLRDLQDLTGQAAFADVMLHTVSPILGIGGWLVFGPRGLTSRTTVAWTTVYVAAWCVFTMVRGAIVHHGDGHFYPYPFMNPVDSGYARVVLNLIAVAAVFLVLGFGAHALDGWLSRRRQPVATRQ